MDDTHERLQKHLLMFLGSVAAIGILVYLAMLVPINFAGYGKTALTIFMILGGTFVGITMGLSIIGFGQYLLSRATERAEVT